LAQHERQRAEQAEAQVLQAAQGLLAQGMGVDQVAALLALTAEQVAALER